MNALHLLSLRYIALLELLALERITSRLRCFSDDYCTINNNIVHAITTGYDKLYYSNRTYWLECRKALSEWYAETYLIEGDNEFVFDFVAVRKLTLRSIQIVLQTHSILDDNSYHELANLLDDILVGYKSATHKTKKLYPVRSKHRMVKMYSQEVV
jgi:hypothetical protein